MYDVPSPVFSLCLPDWVYPFWTLWVAVLCRPPTFNVFPFSPTPRVHAGCYYVRYTNTSVLRVEGGGNSETRSFGQLNRNWEELFHLHNEINTVLCDNRGGVEYSQRKSLLMELAEIKFHSS